MKDNGKDSSTKAEESSNAEPVSDSRREAVAKIAYASPLVAGLLFTRKADAQIGSGGPPAPPG
ncbi:MAG: hypothetical protein AB8B97_07250 [Granulosicoccus sp.]